MGSVRRTGRTVGQGPQEPPLQKPSLQEEARDVLRKAGRIISSSDINAGPGSYILYITGEKNYLSDRLDEDGHARVFRILGLTPSFSPGRPVVYVIIEGQNTIWRFVLPHQKKERCEVGTPFKCAENVLRP